MTQLRKQSDGTRLLSYDLFALLRSQNTSFNEGAFNFPAAGYDVVLPTTRPVHDVNTQSVQQIDAVLTAPGHYEQRWEILALDAATIATKVAGLKTQLITAIDTHIATIYQLFQRFDNEYKMREAAARAFKAALYVGDAGLYITGYATYTGQTPTAATDIVIGKADALKAALSTMADLRMKKNLVLSAATAADAQTIYDGIISQSTAIAEAL